MTSLLRAALITPIRLYQWTISPFIPAACRFAPSCSTYAAEAIAMHGPIKGMWLATLRLARCHPWGGSGYDPVPQAHRHHRAHESCHRHT